MIKYNSNNIADWDFGTSNIVKVYRNGAVCYYKVVVGETAQTPCYAVVDDITQYQYREFENVFNKADDKWYKLNNLNEYEEYGVYASGRTECSGGTPTSRLPQGYTEVEYIENTGSSTINTNFYPNTNTRVLCEMEMITTQAYPKLFGAGTWNVNNSLFIEFGNTLSVHWIGSSAVNYSDYPKSFAFAKHKYDLNKGNLYIDETLVGTKSYSSVVSVSSPLGIFSYINGSTAGNADEHFLGKLYTFKIYDDGTLVREFIPAKRDSDNVAGLYDIVNDVFYTPMESNAPLVAGEPITPTDCVTTYEGKLTIDGDYEYQYSGNSWTNLGEVSGSTYPIYYDEIQDPPTQVSFSSMTEAEQYECPYVGLMATINGDLYFFNDNYQWELIPTPSYDNIITYEASAKLNETTSQFLSGLHTNAFSGASGQLTITSHTFENGVGTIEFDGDVITVSNFAFRECYSLTSIAIPDSVTSIGGGAFIRCSGLTSITIPDSVTSIGDSTFDSCSGLTSIDIPNSVTSIGDRAFQYCEGITSIEIPNSVTSISNSAFANCPNITSMTVDSGNTTFDSRGNCNAIIETSANTLMYGCQNTIIPSDVTSIGLSAFMGCTNLTSATIPDSVTSIGDYAFANCTSLTSITIPSSVTTIDTSVFQECTSLSSITIPDSVTSIYGYAFQGCTSLTSVTIHDSVTSIGNQAFAICTSLTSVTVNAITPPSLESNAFYKTNDCPIYVPSGSVEAYKTAWSAYASRIQAIP